jgi:hypothetical protein
MDEPYPPSLGTIMHMADLDKKAEGKKGMALVRARLDALNFRYCWTPGLRNKPKTDWAQVNRHIWRIQAMYNGGDCFLSGFPNALPLQRLWQIMNTRQLLLYLRKRYKRVFRSIAEFWKWYNNARETDGMPIWPNNTKHRLNKHDLSH